MPVRENSSIPLSWDLGSGNNTNTEPPHPPPSRIPCQWHKDVVVFWPTRGAASATTIINIPMARLSCMFRHVGFPPHFHKGGEAITKIRTPRLLIAAHGVYGTAFTSRAHHTPSHKFVSKLLEC